MTRTITFTAAGPVITETYSSRAEIVTSFAPHDTMEAFGEGFALSMQGIRGEKYEGLQAQAWDRGQMAAALCERHGL